MGPMSWAAMMTATPAGGKSTAHDSRFHFGRALSGKSKSEMRRTRRMLRRQPDRRRPLIVLGPVLLSAPQFVFSVVVCSSTGAAGEDRRDEQGADNGCQDRGGCTSNFVYDIVEMCCRNCHAMTARELQDPPQSEGGTGPLASRCGSR